MPRSYPPHRGYRQYIFVYPPYEGGPLPEVVEYPYKPTRDALVREHPGYMPAILEVVADGRQGIIYRTSSWRSATASPLRIAGAVLPRSKSLPPSSEGGGHGLHRRL